MIINNPILPYMPSHTRAPFPSSSAPWSLWTVPWSSGSKISRLSDIWCDGVGLTWLSKFRPTVSSGELSELEESESRYPRSPAADAAHKAKQVLVVCLWFWLSTRAPRRRFMGVRLHGAVYHRRLVELWLSNSGATAAQWSGNPSRRFWRMPCSLSVFARMVDRILSSIMVCTMSGQEAQIWFRPAKRSSMVAVRLVFSGRRLDRVLTLLQLLQVWSRLVSDILRSAMLAVYARL